MFLGHSVHAVCTVLFAQLDSTRSVLESIETRDPPPEMEVGLLTLEDLYPVVTEQQKSEALEKFSVSSIGHFFVVFSSVCYRISERFFQSIYHHITHSLFMTKLFTYLCLLLVILP